MSAIDCTNLPRQPAQPAMRRVGIKPRVPEHGNRDLGDSEHLPYFLFPGMQGELARTLCMAAGWAINITVVEWILLRERRPRAFAER